MTDVVSVTFPIQVRLKGDFFEILRASDGWTFAEETRSGVAYVKVTKGDYSALVPATNCVLELAPVAAPVPPKKRSK